MNKQIEAGIGPGLFRTSINHVQNTLKSHPCNSENQNDIKGLNKLEREFDIPLVEQAGMARCSRV